MEPPPSTTREYDAATVTVVGPFAKLETPYDEAQIARIGTFPNANEIRKSVRNEVWRLYRTAGPQLFASRFASVLFHKARPGQLADYLKFDAVAGDTTAGIDPQRRRLGELGKISGIDVLLGTVSRKRPVTASGINNLIHAKASQRSEVPRVVRHDTVGAALARHV